MNLFRQAKELLDTKAGPEMSEAEAQLIATAIIPLMINADGLFADITIAEGLEELAKIIEEAK